MVEATDIKALNASVGAAKNGIVVARVDVMKAAVRRVVFGEDRCGEAQASLTVGAGVAVHIRGEFRQRNLSRRQRFETRLKGGHQHGGGNALAGDIGDREHDSVFFVRFARPRKNVVIVARYGIRGASGVRHSDTGNLRWRAGKQPALNLLCNLQIALHHDAVRDLQDQQKEKQQSTPEVCIELPNVKPVSLTIDLHGGARDSEHH